MIRVSAWQKYIISTLLFTALGAHADESPPNIGNFALPLSQEPGPFISFGQTLIGKNKMQMNVNTYNSSAGTNISRNLNAALVYGFTDDTALYFNIPLKSDYSTRNHRHISLDDLFAQLEHAVYSKSTARYQDQVTVLGAITIPVQRAESAKQRAKPTTYGTPTYFGGFTYNRTYVKWLGFLSPGYLIIPSQDNIRLGSQFFYQAGIGRNLFSVSNRYFVVGLVEFNGQYSQNDVVFKRKLPNTGGNVITVTPSLWLSTKKMIIQAGVSIPAVQKLNGSQTPMTLAFAGDFVWTFN